jgi:plasmid stabilization system protein ParE
VAEVIWRVGATARIALLDQAVPGAAALILDAVGVLELHPLIGRSVKKDRRELVISRGRTGYVALYSFRARQDVVFVLAVRHQREAGYAVE